MHSGQSARTFNISKTLLKRPDAQPKDKPFELRDSRLNGFILRVQPSGARSYVIQWARGKRKTLAKVGELSPAQAREKAEKVLANVRLNKPPLQGLDSRAEISLGGRRTWCQNEGYQGHPAIICDYFRGHEDYLASFCRE